MELRQLEYFQMASRLKNITRAAERLRVSQPNITVAIKKLENELGIQLFDRSQKQLALTPEGAYSSAVLNSHCATSKTLYSRSMITSSSKRVRLKSGFPQ